MKTIITLLFCSFVLAANAGDQIQMVRIGTNVTERPSTALATNVIKVLQTCGTDSTAYAGNEKSWKDITHSDSFVLLTFGTPRRLAVTTFTNGLAQWTNISDHIEVKSIDQILVPLPVGGAGPLHIFARSGTNVLAYCAWRLSALNMVASEPALRLSSVFPYSNFDAWIKAAALPPGSPGR